MSWQRKAGAVIVALVALAAVVSLVWTPYDPLQTEVVARLQGSSPAHWMGTDQFGRDIASRVMDGARLTLTVAVGAVGLSGLIGVPLGIWAGMRRGASRVVMAGADLLLAFPALLLAIVFTAVFGASIWIVVLAIGIAGIPAFVRVARAGTMQVMQRDYILAARIAKVSGPAIAWRHVLPNIWPLVLTQVSVAVALAILAEAGLSFLGLGAPAPYASWGRMLQASQPYLATSPHLALWPGAAIALTVLGFNLLGNADDRR
ncbi:peptide ABC transporter permease [Corynebacterium sp. HMSC05H05]|uniref:ABC transporter permease n=1 Tax=Corynebacterium pilbarense TaxID=1288393 RepID=A0A9Q4IGX5_9CORY|nr:MULTISPECIES: ABC transporter permease [Corynebacterium]MCZ2220738.1 ABC transporter permease [Corynebacterium pilbarense]OFT58611.1 peptide ABC transporter permease [Corynebacterium sp. HMSC05H05]